MRVIKGRPKGLTGGLLKATPKRAEPPPVPARLVRASLHSGLGNAAGFTARACDVPAFRIMKGWTGGLVSASVNSSSCRSLGTPMDPHSKCLARSGPDSHACLSGQEPPLREVGYLPSIAQGPRVRPRLFWLQSPLAFHCTARSLEHTTVTKASRMCVINCGDLAP